MYVSEAHISLVLHTNISWTLSLWGKKSYTYCLCASDWVITCALIDRAFHTTLLSNVSLQGVDTALSKHKQEEAEYKGVKAHFRMDESGILRLDKVSCRLSLATHVTIFTLSSEIRFCLVSSRIVIFRALSWFMTRMLVLSGCHRSLSVLFMQFSGVVTPFV